MKGMHDYNSHAATQPSDFKQFSASELFCPRCRAAMPVREFLLLVLPDGDLYEYRCAVCTESLGKRKVEQNNHAPILLTR